MRNVAEWAVILAGGVIGLVLKNTTDIPEYLLGWVIAGSTILAALYVGKRVDETTWKRRSPWKR